MFAQVYFHRVRRAYDHHLGQALRGILPDGRYPGVDSLDEYLTWDDVRVLTELKRVAADGSPGGEHARRILERDHYRVAYQTREHPTGAQLRRWDELCRRARERFGDRVAFDSAEKAPHKFNRSMRDFPVVKGPGDPPTSVEEESAVIDALAELRVRRILAPKEDISDVRAFCENLNLNVR